MPSDDANETQPAPAPTAASGTTGTGGGEPLPAPASPAPAVSASTATSTAASALRFGRYEVLLNENGTPCELGRGGMGVTYKARDPELGRVVVLKVISALLLGHDPQARARFRREARSAAGIHHPHIATVFDIGEERGEDYYVMEFIAGEDLLSRLKRDGPLGALAVLRIGRQVAEALAAAWEQGIVHRDIKPSNLMVARRSAEREAREGPLVKVVDFGLAKALKAAADTSSLTQMSSGRSVFSAAYASPEQIEEGEIDIRSDLYSLGVTLWQALTGQPTFGETSYQKAIVGHLSKPPPFDELRAAAVPEALIGVLERLLQKQPVDRLATPEALVTDLAAAERLLLSRSAGNAPPPPEPPVPPAPPLPPAPPPAPRPPPPPDSLSAADLLRRRGNLPMEETLALLDPLARAVDGARRPDDPARPDLDPAHVVFRFPEPPADLDARLDAPVTGWPAFTVEFRPATGTEPFAPLGATLPAPRPEGDALVRLASLVYELLAGQYPVPGRYRPLALNEPVNAVLQRALLGADAGEERFRTAADFAAALRDATGPTWNPPAPPVPLPPPSPPTPPSFLPPAPPSPPLPLTPVPPVPPAPLPPPAPPLPPPPRAGWLLPALAVGGILVVGGVLYFTTRPPRPVPAPPEPSPTPTVASTATPRPTAAPTRPPNFVVATPRPPATPSPSPSPPPAIGAQLAEARSAFARAEYETAQTLFREVLRRDPSAAEAREGLEQIRKIAADISAKGYAAESSDPVAAVKNYRLAAALGSVQAQVNLGIMYETGRGGLAKDDAKAAELYRKAADQGSAQGQKNLGYLYEQGRGGLPKDDFKAVELYRKAADQGNSGGQVNLGYMYRQGRGGLPKDDAKAAELYRKAADQGNAIGQVNLGVLYEQGVGGLPKDEVRAVELYRKAAGQGEASGQAYLGDMYERGGGGLPRDEARAVELYRKAADQGNEFALRALQRLGRSRN